MSLLERDLQSAHRDELRREPISKQIRALLGTQTVVDTVHAQLVWEPRRLLCVYAVPEGDVRAELTPGTSGDAPPADGPILPGVPFTSHSVPGTSLDVRVGDRVLTGAAFRPDEPDLAGLVLLDFRAFDEWFHEQERNVGHPRDPYHRVESLPASRHVTVSLDGTVLAESDHQVIIYESGLPARYYLPPDAVRVELTPTEARTWCAYKGQASYVSVTVGEHTVPDVAWYYPEALSDAERAQGFYCFDDTKVTVSVDPS